MQQWTMLSKAIRYQKAASDNIFSLISVMQNNSDKLLKNTLDRYTWLPEEGKKGCLFLANSCLQTTANMKAIIDTGYDGVNRLFDHTGTNGSSPGSSTAKSGTEAAAPEKPQKPAVAAKKAAPKKKAASARKSPAKPAAKKTITQKKSAPKVSAAAAPVSTAKAAAPEKAEPAKQQEMKTIEAAAEKEVKKESSNTTEAKQK